MHPDQNHAFHMAHELQLVKASRVLGLDTITLRLKHTMTSGFVTAPGAKITSCGLDECVQKATEKVR